MEETNLYKISSLQEADSIYGSCRDFLPLVEADLVSRIQDMNKAYYEETGCKLYEHLESRIKAEASMQEKIRSRKLPMTPHTALKELHDAIGIRVVCSFISDIYKIVEKFRTMEGCTISREKDYIRNAKPNGYRSYHLILDIEEPFADIEGKVPGHYPVEVQLRTIAMDSWAALEHQMKYKKDIPAQELIISELKRCADDLAACDVSMQTLRDLIQGGNR